MADDAKIQGSQLTAVADGKHQWEVIEARVDWLTLTAPIGRGDAELFRGGYDLLLSRAGSGDRQKHWRSQGYSGDRCNGVMVGQRPDSTCVQLSGESAHSYGRTLAMLPGRGRRIDLCVTAVCDVDASGLAKRTYRMIMAARAQGERPRKLRLIENSEGGATLYVGSRTDDLFYRLYNKGAESPDDYPANSWRWEIELKGATALGQWAQFQQDYPNAHDIATLVSAYFQRAGVGTPMGAAKTYRDWRAPRERSSLERSLRWLKEGVAPAVARLQAHYDDDVILQALGLQPWQAPIRRGA